MLVEIKAKVTRIINDKTRRRLENFIVPDCEAFAEAELTVLQHLTREQASHIIEDFEIQGLRLSVIREVCTQYEGGNTFVVTFKDIFIADNGDEKPIKYKILLWADDLDHAMVNARDLVSQGYNMSIDGIKEQQYEYLTLTEEQ